MKEQILEKLAKIEQRENITVLYAVETGSRAWGHANENSDYDIRFIYRCNDVAEYLVLDKFRDVIQYEEGVFDFVGWDIKKALYLHFKSNPNLREWMISPVVYISDEIGIFEGFPNFNPEILKHHYFGLAHKTYKKYIRSKDVRDLKVVKKTLYVTRCVLSWQLLDRGIFPPANFSELIEKSEISEELKEAILTLRKSYSTLDFENVGDEVFCEIHNWIGKSQKSFKKKSFKNPKRNIDDYNLRFQEIIGV
ncbi:DNA polymerase beta superfamily protein [uncultured Methanobrevibacter sp.]|uniref:nucleotidyltransferase domain-containing protein n=1 Tax=uncultured Methanobrevibacter sp. TaxID=253161 RepID=UPI00260B2F8E|nr:nucleotidyltransferase domain-containing protein [uncultured Methanobrevibacter sp.]